MPLKVSFMRPAYAGSIDVLALGPCRVCETLSAGVISTNSAQDGEIMMVLSTEAAPIVIAIGTTPNGAATAATQETTAGMPLPANVLVPIQCRVGDRVEFEAFV